MLYRLSVLLWLNPTPGGLSDTIYMGTPTWVDVVLAGGIAGWIFARRQVRGVQGTGLPGWLNGRTMLLSAVAVSLIWRTVRVYGSTALDVVAYPVMGSLLALIMFWLVEHPASAASRLLRSRPLRVIGTLSFGLYLWHLTALDLTHWLVNPYRPLTQPWLDVWIIAMMVPYLALCFAITTVGYLCVEQPFRRLRRGFAPSRRAQGRASSTQAVTRVG
jgi:peptidoglycan/LPS O-acetylase OafA/YrhL